MKKLLALLCLLSVPAYANTNTLGSDQTIFYGNGTSVMDIGVLGPQTLNVHPNGTTRFAVSDTSMQMHYDNIILGKDNFGTVGGFGGDITWKLKNPGHADVPLFNMGYSSSSPYKFFFETGSTTQQAVETGFYNYDGAGNEIEQLVIPSGTSTSYPYFKNSVGIGTSGTIYNGAGVAKILSLSDSGSAGISMSNLTKEYDFFVVTGYSNSFGLYNVQAGLYALMDYPNGHMIIDGTNDNGVDNLQVTGTEYISGSNLILATFNTPASSSAACVKGTINLDVNYIYICTATNTWKRSALSTF